MKVIIGIAISLLGTTLGAGMVFFLKGQMSARLQKLLLGFASGVMIVASVWSLLISAIDMAEASGTIARVPALQGIKNKRTIVIENHCLKNLILLLDFFEKS